MHDVRGQHHHRRSDPHVVGTGLIGLRLRFGRLGGERKAGDENKARSEMSQHGMEPIFYQLSQVRYSKEPFFWRCSSPAFLVSRLRQLRVKMGEQCPAFAR